MVGYNHVAMALIILHLHSSANQSLRVITICFSCVGTSENALDKTYFMHDLWKFFIDDLLTLIGELSAIDDDNN